VRLTFDSLNVYEVLEPLLDDYRKLRFRGMGESSSLLSLLPATTNLVRAQLGRWIISSDDNRSIRRRSIVRRDGLRDSTTSINSTESVGRNRRTRTSTE